MTVTVVRYFSSTVTATAVDVASMSSAERRELLAKLGGFMGDE